MIDGKSDDIQTSYKSCRVVLIFDTNFPYLPGKRLLVPTSRPQDSTSLNATTSPSLCLIKGAVSQYGHASLICNPSIPLRVPFLLRVRAGVAFHPDLAGPAHVQRRRAVAERDFGTVVRGGPCARRARRGRVLAGKGARWPVGLVIGELG